MAQDFKQIDSTIDVVTPENISFQYQMAGPFRRLPAFLIDVSIRLAIWFILFIGLGLMLGSGVGSAGFAFWLLAWFVMEWFYGGLLETYWNGQTLGKRILGIRVLRVDGQPINGLEAVMRNILRAVDMMPLVPISPLIGQEIPVHVPIGLFGLLTPVMNRRSQRLGDLVCGTMVVVEQRSWLLGAAKLEDPRTSRLAAEIPGTFQVSRKLGQALAAYVERRRQLSLPRRDEIAKHLGDLLVPRFGLPDDTSHDLLLCALYYRTFVADQGDEGASATQEFSFIGGQISDAAVSPTS